jgi:hypothetical protein
VCLMASKMLMADDTLALHLSSTFLVIDLIKFIIVISELFSVSCISRDKLLICNRDKSVVPFMSKVFVFTIFDELLLL